MNKHLASSWPGLAQTIQHLGAPPEQTSKQRENFAQTSQETTVSQAKKCSWRPFVCAKPKISLCHYVNIAATGFCIQSNTQFQKHPIYLKTDVCVLPCFWKVLLCLFDWWYNPKNYSCTSIQIRFCDVSLAILESNRTLGTQCKYIFISLDSTIDPRQKMPPIWIPRSRSRDSKITTPLGGIFQCTVLFMWQ